MNVILWVLQALLALHTAVGAVWKVSNSEQNIPSLRAIPHGAWRALIGIELLCSVGLLLPAAMPSLAVLVPVAAGVIAAEMLLFTAVHLGTGDKSRGPIGYWLVVAALCGFIVYGRLAWIPIG